MVRRIQKGRYHIPNHAPPQAQRLICNMLTMDPMQCPTVEQILQHPWVMQGEETSPHQDSEPLPKRPDPTITAALLDMGHDPYETWASLTSGRFDDAAATYLILQHQLSQVARCVFKGRPFPPGIEPHPTPQTLLMAPSSQGEAPASLPFTPSPCPVNMGFLRRPSRQGRRT
ncbi:Sperm motility kinase 3 [Sciurus carolinensis]|uniref:non-specific serine/threonine protein kinase n=1 Tax=Sciurus carolinensis TaxID=30640 RepID=A0AA41T2B6_SCICA|nr:Sperm motility kinase 3 [Sciurus carolinensis]